MCNFRLENRPGVTEVRLLDRKPAERSIIDTWEQVKNDRFCGKVLYFRFSCDVASVDHCIMKLDS